MNFSDTQNLKKHWETITNLDAIEVNQDYAGFSGSMFYNSTETEQFKPCSWWARDDCKFPVAMSWYKPLSGRDARKSTMAVRTGGARGVSGAESCMEADATRARERRP